ncbi:hypothetical protein GCM10029963_49690 [Micromonospora andamanensis]
MRLGAAIEAQGPPGSRLGLLAGYLHLVMIAGVLATGVGSRLMIIEPFSRDPVAVVTMGAGPALFLTGWILFALAVQGRISWHRVIGMAAILVAVAAAHEQPLLVNSAIVTGLLILIAHGDTLAGRARRRSS